MLKAKKLPRMHQVYPERSSYSQADAIHCVLSSVETAENYGAGHACESIDETEYIMKQLGASYSI